MAAPVLRDLGGNVKVAFAAVAVLKLCSLRLWHNSQAKSVADYYSSG